MSVTTPESPPVAARTTVARVGGGLLDPALLWRSLPQALRKLNPATLWRNPVMFVVEVGSVLTTALAVIDPSAFAWLISGWLWLTVVFGNLAEAVAEGRGKAQADTLRRTRKQTMARRLAYWGDAAGDSSAEDSVAAADLCRGDAVVVAAGEVIPADGEVVEGVASVDESAITGESAPVIRESGGDRSAVTGGTTVLSDRIVVRITQEPGEGFLDRMIALVEGAKRKKTPNEIALNLLLLALTVVFLVAVVTVQPLAIFSKNFQGAAADTPAITANGVTMVVLVALLVCLIPTTIGGLLSAIGIAGMDRMVQRNVLAMSGRAVEAAGDIRPCCWTRPGNTNFYNTTLVIAMLLGRYVPILFVLALAGRLAKQQPGAVTVGTLRAGGVNFIVLATGTALLLALLNFLPALSLGALAGGLH